MDQVTEREKAFYEDEKSKRQCRLSEETDEKFEEEKQDDVESEVLGSSMNSVILN